MHIGIITPGFSASEADWCIPALLDFIHHPPRNITFSIITLRYPHHTTPYSVYGADVTPLGFAKRAGLWRYMLYRKAIQTLKAIHEQKPFDMLHAFWADEAGFIAVRAGKQLKIPAVVSVMGGELVNFPEIDYGHGRSLIGRMMIHHALHHATVLTGGSVLLINQIQQKLEGQKMPLARIPLGVDIGLFRPNGDKQNLAGDFKILHVASLSPIKNQALLIHAFAKFQQGYKKAHLHIVGDGVQKSALKELVKELGLKKVVSFHGEIAHHEMPSYYRAADICALTSYHESQSLVALEAGACGVGTVGTSVGILPELMDTEWLIHPPTPPQLGDADGLAQIFARLANDDIQRVNLSGNIRSRVMTDYSLMKSAQVWGEIYPQVVG